MVPCDLQPVLFLGTASGVVGLEVRVVVCARRDLTFLRRIGYDGDLVAGVFEDSARWVAYVGAFKFNLEADVEEILIESDDMVAVWSAHDFCSIVARLHNEAGDFDNGSHSDDTGVGGEVAQWLIGGSLVGYSEGLSVGASVGQSLGRERRQDVGLDLVGDSVGRTTLVHLWGYWLDNLGRERCGDVGRALVGNSVG